MDTSQQIQLGFDQMKAAIAGGHDLFCAFLEAADMTRHGENPHVVSGVLGCFLFCTEAVEQDEAESHGMF